MQIHHSKSMYIGVDDKQVVYFQFRKNHKPMFSNETSAKILQRFSMVQNIVFPYPFSYDEKFFSKPQRIGSIFGLYHRLVQRDLEDRGC
jgi:hypothetical protein